ncbi:PepSY domain-containing protein [Roseomonas sp. CECT 9278]|uniref:PepSY domain-containing protein n=1 Tax=Roseomonas sp. CECT 9278 TaxID=2845823 RepID=UPI001E2A864D|nr:PepSY domain-containing protein [Roseomonas sp. CECT 9278]CAH0236127.1 hypothetical protein ROS9278_02775 [Roseomonas sp. CECT 9278]
MMLRPLLLTALVAALPLVTPPARADDGCRGRISAEDAIRIARAAGLVRVTDVDCDDGKWEVEGRDARGREIEVDVSAHDGRILDVDRDD